MKTRLFENVASLGLAMLVTLGMLVSIDHLATSEPASAQWAAAVAAPKA